MRPLQMFIGHARRSGIRAAIADARLLWKIIRTGCIYCFDRISGIIVRFEGYRQVMDYMTTRVRFIAVGFIAKGQIFVNMPGDYFVVTNQGIQFHIFPGRVDRMWERMGFLFTFDQLAWAKPAQTRKVGHSHNLHDSRHSSSDEDSVKMGFSFWSVTPVAYRYNRLNCLS